MPRGLAKNKKLIWLSLLIHVLTGFGSVSLCFSGGETCGFESPSRSCCPSAAFEAASCAPCVDIDLSFRNLDTRPRPSRAQAAQFATPAVPAPAGLGPQALPSFPTREYLLARPSLALVALRTVVLLT